MIRIFLPIFIAIIFCVKSSETYKILLIFPVPARSHYNLGSALAKGLADAGHNVTIVSPYKEKYVPKKGSYREIVLTGLSEKLNGKERSKELFKFEEKSFTDKIETLFYYGQEITQELFVHEEFRKLLNSNETFGATIVDQFILDSLKGLPAYFDSHQILLCPIASTAWADFLVANPSLPSFGSDLLSIFSTKMNFWERLGNTIIAILGRLFHHYYILTTANAILKRYLPNAVDLNDAIYNVSLILVNSHPSISHAKNKVPNMIDVAGFHLNPPKELPKDLKEYLDNSKNGIVYFSMGSVTESKNMPLETRNLILRSLGSLKEDVLWKWEENNLPEQPKNVKIEKWLSQESILAHPNVKLFITHGGLLSTIEAIYYGVPMVVIPLFADQISNARHTKEIRLGDFIRFQDLEEQKLSKLIKKVLADPKYKENANQRSALMRDRQVPPLETAIYWVEYIIRHNGAKHLRMAAIDLTWYQYYLLDVIGFLLSVVILVFFISKLIISWIFCKSRKDLQEKVKLS